jgi:hypothetical protein
VSAPADTALSPMVAAALPALKTPSRPPVHAVTLAQTRQPLTQEEARLRPPPLFHPSAAQEDMLYAPIR